MHIIIQFENEKCKACKSTTVFNGVFCLECFTEFIDFKKSNHTFDEIKTIDINNPYQPIEQLINQFPHINDEELQEYINQALNYL